MDFSDMQPRHLDHLLRLQIKFQELSHIFSSSVTFLHFLFVFRCIGLGEQRLKIYCAHLDRVLGCWTSTAATFRGLRERSSWCLLCENHHVMVCIWLISQNLRIHSTASTCARTSMPDWKTRRYKLSSALVHGNTTYRHRTSAHR